MARSAGGSTGRVSNSGFGSDERTVTNSVKLRAARRTWIFGAPLQGGEVAFNRLRCLARPEEPLWALMPSFPGRVLGVFEGPKGVFGFMRIDRPGDVWPGIGDRGDSAHGRGRGRGGRAGATEHQSQQHCRNGDDRLGGASHEISPLPKRRTPLLALPAPRLPDSVSVPPLVPCREAGSRSLRQRSGL